MTPDRVHIASPAFRAACYAELAKIEADRRRKAAQALHRKPDPMSARERAEREAAAGEMG